MSSIQTIYLSAGHNYFGHHGLPPGGYAIQEVRAAECVAGRGLRGDRFFDYQPNYKGQVTLFAAEVLAGLRAEFARPDLSFAAVRRNVLVAGLDLTALIGQCFQLQGVELEGVEECKPCHWMNQAIGIGAEAWLRGRGGLRCRIRTDGWLRPEGGPPLLGAIMAGGESSRMGSDKAELMIAGVPLWRRQDAVLRAAGAETVVLVRRPGQPAPLGLPCCRDTIPHSGPLAGLQAALSAGPAAYVAVLAVDMPAIDAGWFHWLWGFCGPGRGAMARHAETCEPLAAIYPAEALGEIEWRLHRGELSLQRLALALAEQGRLAMVPLPAERRAAIRSMNRSEDWQDFNPEWARQNSPSLSGIVQ